MDISELDIGIRAYNGLRRVGIESVEQLKTYTDEQLLAIPNFGKISLASVRAAIGPAPNRNESTPYVYRSVANICKKLGLEPRFVKRLELTPRTAIATVYKKNEHGQKYLSDLGEAATEVLVFEIRS